MTIVSKQCFIHIHVFKVSIKNLVSNLRLLNFWSTDTNFTITPRIKHAKEKHTLHWRKGQLLQSTSCPTGKKKWKLGIQKYKHRHLFVYTNLCSHSQRSSLCGEKKAQITMLKSVINCTMMSPLSCLFPTETCNHILVKRCIQYPGLLQVHPLICSHFSAPNLEPTLLQSYLKWTQLLKYMQHNCQVLSLIITYLTCCLQLKKCFFLDLKTMKASLQRST